MYYSNGAGLVQDIAKAVNGEYSAIQCYGYLIKVANTEAEKKVITEIRKDEIRHFQTFSQIYTSLTGTKPSARVTEPCPAVYREGLEAALKDEQETVDFYLEIAEKAEEPYIKEHFRRAAADEQNHAVWFLYYYTKICCGKPL